MITSFVPGFESIIDQQRPTRILTSLLHRGNIPHALLFTGLEGVGKKDAAVALAMAANCRATEETGCREGLSLKRAAVDTDAEQGPPKEVRAGCGACASCRKIESGSHPDVHRLAPNGPAIKIGQVRTLAEQVLLKPYEAKYRVIIIAEAQKLNASAANALLKLLEEPPDRTLFILTAPQPGDLLPTVASRCQLIRFNPISQDHLRRLLIETHGATDNDAEIIAALAGGSAKRAAEMAESNWLARRKWLIGQLMNASPGAINHLMALADFLAGDRDRLLDDLAIMQTWLRDLLVHFYDPGKIINSDLTAMIPPPRTAWRPEAIIDKMKSIDRARGSIEANANPRLTCEALLIELISEAPWQK